MANCSKCGKKLSIFSGWSICKECRAALALEESKKKSELSTEFSTIQNEIIRNADITDQQIAQLKKQDKKSLISLYLKVYEEFESDKELDEIELNTLLKIQDAFDLSRDDVCFYDKVLPYVYVSAIRKLGNPPRFAVDGKLEGITPIYKKGETAHFMDIAVLKEKKSVSLGYVGGSHGVSIPLGMGIRYRVGSYRGHIQKEEQLVVTSLGMLVITNQRLLLQPRPGYKPLSIPLNDILSYHCFENGIEVYKDGREKGYFFSIKKSSSVEIFGICLEHFLKQNLV
jgi:hypothetical protein